MRGILRAAMSGPVLASLGAVSSHANLVANPGFEANDTGSGPVTPPTGSFASEFGCSLSHVIATSPRRCRSRWM